MITITKPEHASASQSGFLAHLRQVKVEGHRDCNTLGTRICRKTTASWCDMFHLLFGLSLDDMHIHFKAPFDDCTQSVSKVSVQSSNTITILSQLCDLVDDVSLEKGIVHWASPLNRLMGDVSDFLEAFEAQVNSFTRTRRVGTKSIYLLWNLDQEQKLDTFNMKCIVWRRRAPFYNPVEAEKQTYYRVHNKADSAGEIQITCSMRWAHTEYSLTKGLDRGDDMPSLHLKSQDIGAAVAVAEEAAKK
jgi:hypothetical protein